jgi:hypothetical protein
VIAAEKRASLLGGARVLLASSCPRNAGVSPQCRTSTSKSAA